jgi:hypothetical protein
MERTILSKDIALITDTLLISPNKINIDYPDNLGLYQTIIENKDKENVKIYTIEDGKPKYDAIFQYFQNPKIMINDFIYPKTEDMIGIIKTQFLIFDIKTSPQFDYKLSFSKTYKDLLITSDKTTIIQTPVEKQLDDEDSSILDVDTKIDNWKINAKTYVDIPSFKPGGSYSDIKNEYECSAVKRILDTLLYVKLSKSDSCNEELVNSRLTQIEGSNFVIILREEIGDENINQAKIFYDSKNSKSKKFAFLLKNNLLKNNVLETDILLKPISEYQDNLGEKIILEKNTGILFFAGNLNHKYGGILSSGSSLTESIKEYYEN